MEKTILDDVMNSHFIFMRFFFLDADKIDGESEKQNNLMIPLLFK